MPKERKQQTLDEAREENYKAERAYVGEPRKEWFGKKVGEEKKKKKKTKKKYEEKKEQTAKNRRGKARSNVRSKYEKDYESRGSKRSAERESYEKDYDAMADDRLYEGLSDTPGKNDKPMKKSRRN